MSAVTERLLDDTFVCDFCDRPAPEAEQHLGIAGLYWLGDGRTRCLSCIVEETGKGEVEAVLKALHERWGDAA